MQKHQPDSEYAAAVWRWLRAEIPAEPSPVTYSIDPSVAASIKAQCTMEYRSKNPSLKPDGQKRG